jgi:rare lipoprotein A
MAIRLHTVILRVAFSAMLLSLTDCTTQPEPPPPQPVPVQAEQPIYSERGMASWYGPAHQGRTTADGETFDQQALTAAHRNLPFGTVVKVTNLSNGKSIKVRINDRGPYVKGRILDLSKRAADEIGIAGTARVRIEQYNSDQQAAVTPGS